MVTITTQESTEPGAIPIGSSCGAEGQQEALPTNSGEFAYGHGAASRSAQRLDGLATDVFQSVTAEPAPVITLNGQNLPGPQGGSPGQTGWQLVIFDATQDITKPAAVLYNRYIRLVASSGNSWMGSYPWMYKQIVNAILTTGNIDTQMILLASYGLDANTPPTNDALSVLLGLGAGEQLQYWETHVDVGSQVGNNTSWTSYPANYILLGSSSWSYGQGNEIYQFPGSTPVTTTLDVNLGG